MNKTFAYWAEKFIGIFIALLLTILANSHRNFFFFIGAKDFFDKLISITTTLFGFLLAVLTLIIQSTSPTILLMKKHGSYKRLVNYNKTIVLLSAIVCFASLMLILGREKLKSDQLYCASLLNYFLFIWTCVDTLIFVFIFYRIILSEETTK